MPPNSDRDAGHLADRETRSADSEQLRARTAEIRELGEQIEALAQTVPPK